MENGIVILIKVFQMKKVFHPAISFKKKKETRNTIEISVTLCSTVWDRWPNAGIRIILLTVRTDGERNMIWNLPFSQKSPYILQWILFVDAFILKRIDICIKCITFWFLILKFKITENGTLNPLMFEFDSINCRMHL